MPTPAKRNEMDAFASEVNALLENSLVLLSTNGGALVTGGASAEQFMEDYEVLIPDKVL